MDIIKFEKAKKYINELEQLEDLKAEIRFKEENEIVKTYVKIKNKVYELSEEINKDIILSIDKRIDSLYEKIDQI